MAMVSFENKLSPPETLQKLPESLTSLLPLLSISYQGMLFCVRSSFLSQEQPMLTLIFMLYKLKFCFLPDTHYNVAKTIFCLVEKRWIDSSGTEKLQSSILRGKWPYTTIGGWCESIICYKRCKHVP